MCDFGKFMFSTASDDSGSSNKSNAGSSGGSDLAKSLDVFGAVGSAFGAIFEGENTAQQAEFQSRIYGINADIARSGVVLLKGQAELAVESADLAYAKGALAESRARRQGDEVASAQAVHFASAHLDPASGSPLLLAARSASELQADVDLIRAGAAVEGAEAFGRAAELEQRALAAEGQVFTARVGQASSQAKASSARIAGYIGAGTAILKGASRAFGGVGR